MVCRKCGSRNLGFAEYLGEYGNPTGYIYHICKDCGSDEMRCEDNEEN